MRKGKLIRSALAAGMALALVATPFGAGAETLDETELASNLEDAMEESVGALASGPVEGYANVEFSDGLYNMVAEEGGDASWLKNVSAHAKVVPGETLDLEVVASLNDTVLCTLLASVDPATGSFCLSIPELFDQAIVVDLQSLVQSTVSGGSTEGGMYNQLIQMAVGAGNEIANQLVSFFNSLPEDVWQQEMANYMTPVMNALEQEVGQDVITIGDASAEVQAQIIDIPSEKMQNMISELLDTLSNDTVLEALLQSEAVQNISSLVSMLSGGQVSISGSQLLEQLRAAIGQVASSDFSQLPGLRFVLHSSEDGSAGGFYIGAFNGGELIDLFTYKAIEDGTENCFEVIPGDLLLAMAGADTLGSIDILGQGSTADDKLNEVVELTANGETVGTFTIADLDLVAAQIGEMIGTFRCDIMDQSVQITYDVEDDGTRTVLYEFNDEVFYNASVWVGEVEDDTIDKVDVENAVEIASADDIVNWIGSFNTEALFELLAEAGAPVGEDIAA